MYCMQYVVYRANHKRTCIDFSNFEVLRMYSYVSHNERGQAVHGDPQYLSMYERSANNNEQIQHTTYLLVQYVHDYVWLTSSNGDLQQFSMHERFANNQYSRCHSWQYNSTYMITFVCQAPSCQLLLLSIPCPTLAHDPPTMDPRKHTCVILCIHTWYVFSLRLLLDEP